MVAALPRKVNIHYRLAKISGPPGLYPTLQEQLQKVLKGPLGLDARQRIFPITDDSQHKACLNYSEIGQESILADVMHLDGRSVLPTWMTPTTPKPVAEVIPKTLEAGEASLSEPVYIMVRGNHVAAIERLGFRNHSVQRYLNALLAAGGQLEPGAAWTLDPKIELIGSTAALGGTKKLIFKPNAALVGEQAGAENDRATVRSKTISRRMGDMIASGRRVIDMAVAAGADETKIEALRASMSNDLSLKARLEISVSSVHRRTEAEIPTDAVQKAFAELTSLGDVTIRSEDGRTDGKLVQLVHVAEVLETGGLIDWQRATYALISAMNSWAAKGSIDLST